MSADQDHVFQDENDQRRIQDEMMAILASADRKVLARVRVGLSTYSDFVYLAGRLNLNSNELEK